MRTRVAAHMGPNLFTHALDLQAEGVARRLECGQVESADRYRKGSWDFLALLRAAGVCIIDATELFGK